MESDQAVSGRPSAFVTIVYGGLVIGVLDFIDASTFFPLYFGISFWDVWHGPASGLIGREASRSGGVNTALLGIVLHFVVATCIATVYYLASRYLSFLIRHPIISGMAFGVIANLVMQWVVIPLSAIGYRPPAETIDWGSQMNNYIGHALLVGLPVALIASWSARKNVGLSKA